MYVCPALKKLLVFFLTVSILSQALVNVCIVGYYHINKQYITEKLCVNKNKPSLGCNGQCYLSKQLKKAEDGERKQLNILKEKDEILPLQHTTVVAFTSNALNIVSLPLPYIHTVNTSTATSLLKPPTT